MNSLFERLGLASSWSQEAALAVVGLLLGIALPALIYVAGVMALGKYEGASLGHLYGSVIDGLKEPSLAAWAVLLGPYGLFLLFRGLRGWWRAGTEPA
jgi:hypothetical protein